MGLGISADKSSRRSLSIVAKTTVAGPAVLFKSNPCTSKVSIVCQRHKPSFWLHWQSQILQQAKCHEHIFSVSCVTFLRSAISPLASAAITSSPTLGLPIATIKSPGTFFQSVVHLHLRIQLQLTQRLFVRFESCPRCSP